MVIEIGGYQHGPWMTKEGFRIEPPECDLKTPHEGHFNIQVRNTTLPHWERRPPWASLEFAIRPPQGAAETLRWAVRFLDDALRRPPSPTSPSSRPTFSDDDWDVMEPMTAQEAHGVRTGVRESSLDTATG